MRNSWLIFSLLVVSSLIFLLLQYLAAGTQTVALLHANDLDPASHLPLILAPEATVTPSPTATITPTATLTPTATATPTDTPTPEPGLINGSFEACIPNEILQKCDWPTLENGNQPPLTGWVLYQVPKGEPLFGSTDLASEVSEAKHLESPQNIPPHEQIGQEAAIILQGKVTYKMFSRSESFGNELKQTVSLDPGSKWRLTVPINAHFDGETDENAAESSASVNNQPGQPWANLGGMINRRFCKHTVVFTVPPDGQAHISIKVKSKYRNAKDFFIDDVTLVPFSDPVAHESMPDCQLHSTLGVERRPKGANQYRDSWMGSQTLRVVTSVK